MRSCCPSADGTPAPTTTQIDFTPWLNSGTDTDLTTTGFQPDLSSLTVAPSTISLQLGTTGRIQEAINLAQPGPSFTVPEIFVLSGAYTEDVNVNKNVIVSMAGGSVTGKISGTTGTIVATGTLSLGDGSTSGVDMATNLTVGSQLVTLLDSDGASLNGNTSLATGTLTEANGVIIGGTLSGNGTVAGAVSTISGGQVSPGIAGPGLLNTGSLTLTSGSSLDVDVDGTTAGTGYDQVQATGTISLGNATLNMTAGYFPVINDSYTIIKNVNGNPVSGTFNGLIEGATFFVGGTEFSITYQGNGTNDVVIKAIAYSIVYVNANFANPVLGEDPDGPGPAHVFGGDAFATIQAGINAVAPGGTVYVYASTYTETVTVNKVLTLGIGGPTPTLGIVDLNGNLNFTVTGSTLQFDISGTTPGTGYDQLDSTGGTITLTNAILNANFGSFTPSAGDEYVLVQQAGGTVSGNFVGLAEGQALTLAGVPFHITYQGGPGGASAALVADGPFNVTGTGLTVKQNGNDIEVLNSSNMVVDQRPISSVSQVNLIGVGGMANTATVDYSGGEFTIPVTFTGGTGAGSTNTLIVTGNSFTNEIVTFTPSDANGNNGSINLDGRIITFSHLKPLTSSVSAGNLTFDLPNSSNNAIFEASGVPATPLQSAQHGRRRHL